MHKKNPIHNSRKNFLEQVENARTHLWKILHAYELLENDDNEKTSDKFPFGTSYDEWLFEYDAWIDALNNVWFPKEQTFEPTVTVGEMKEILDKYTDDTQIVLGTNSWYKNITKIQLPDDYETYTITLYIGEDFSTTQL